MDNLLINLINLAKQRNCKIAVAESCTGGMLGSQITGISGASEVFLGGVISYSNEIKRDLLGVEQGILDKFGAVSEECAAQMAGGVAKLCKADLSVSITGIAGPNGGSLNKPVGLVCFGVYSSTNITTYREIFSGNREEIRQKACDYALQLMIRGLSY